MGISMGMLAKRGAARLELGPPSAPAQKQKRPCMRPRMTLQACQLVHSYTTRPASPSAWP